MAAKDPDMKSKVFAPKMLTVQRGGSVLSSLMELNGCTFSFSRKSTASQDM